MNFIIGWVIGVIALVLAIVAAAAWVSGAYSQRRQTQQQKQ